MKISNKEGFRLLTFSLFSPLPYTGWDGCSDHLPSPGKRREVHPVSSETSAVTEQVLQPESFSQPVSPGTSEPESQGVSKMKPASQRSVSPRKASALPDSSRTWAAPGDSTPSTRRAAVPMSIGAAPATTIPHPSLEGQKRSQGPSGPRKATGHCVPKSLKDRALLEDTASASGKLSHAGPSVPVTTDGTLSGSTESPVIDIDKFIGEAPEAEAWLSQSPQRADCRAHQDIFESQPPGGAGGGSSHHAQTVRSDQTSSPRKTGGTGSPPPPQWTFQSSVLDSVHPDKQLAGNKNFLNNYSRNFSSFHEDGVSLAGPGGSSEPSPSSMYGDAEDSSSDPESLAEDPRAAARNNWPAPPSRESSRKEDSSESEEEQIEICAPGGCPKTPVPAQAPAQAAFGAVSPVQQTVTEPVGDSCERACFMPGASNTCIPGSPQPFSFLDVSSPEHETWAGIHASQSHVPGCAEETMAVSSTSPVVGDSQPSQVTRSCGNTPFVLKNPDLVNGRDLLDEGTPNEGADASRVMRSMYALGAEGPKNGEAVLANLHNAKDDNLEGLLQKPKTTSRRPVMTWFKDIDKDSQGTHLKSKSEKEQPSMLAMSPGLKGNTVNTSHRKRVAVSKSPPPQQKSQENKDLPPKSPVETLSNCQKPKGSPKLKRLNSKNKTSSEVPGANPAKGGRTDPRKSLPSPQASHKMLSKAVSHRLHIADQEEPKNTAGDAPKPPQSVPESKPPLAASGSLRTSASDTSIRTFTSPLTSPKSLPEQGANSRFHMAVYLESDTSCPTASRSPRYGPESKVPHANTGSVSPSTSRTNIALAGVRQSKQFTPSRVDLVLTEAAQPQGVSEKGIEKMASDPLERTNQLKIIEISSERMPKNACGDKPPDSDRKGGFLTQSNCQERSSVRLRQSAESSPKHPPLPPSQVEREMRWSYSVARLASSSSSPQLPAKMPDSSQGKSSQMPSSVGSPKNGVPVGLAGEEHPYFALRPATRTYSMPAQFSSHFGREGPSPPSPSYSPQDPQVPAMSGSLSEKTAKGVTNGQGVYSVKPLLETPKNQPPVDVGDVSAVPEASGLIPDKLKVTRRHYYCEQSWPHESTSFFSVKQRIKSFENLANSDRPAAKSATSPFLSVSSKPPVNRRSSGSITSGSPGDGTARSLRRSLSSCSENQSEASSLLPQMTKSPSSVTLTVSRQNLPETNNKGHSPDPKKSLVPVGIPTSTGSPASPIKRNKSSVRHAQPSPVSRSKLQELRALSMPDLDKLCSGEDYSASPGAVLFRTQLEITPRKSQGSPATSPASSPARGHADVNGSAFLSCPVNGGNRVYPKGNSSPTSEPAVPTGSREAGESLRAMPSGKSWSVK